ncbi:MAG: NUDIX hydrolase [Pseudomonadota bacterium]
MTHNSVTLAVGAVILKDQDVLLIKRGRAPFLGHWSIPGGKVDFGESLETALHREIKEETGVTIKTLGLINAFEALPEHEGDRHFVMIDYACAYVSGDVRAGDDAMEAAFFPLPEALSKLAWDKTRQAVQGALAFTEGNMIASNL